MSRFFLLWLSIVASCSLAGCGADADAGAAAVTPSATIQQVTPARGTLDDTVVAYGQGVAGSDGVRALSLPVDATLTATDVVAGQAVRAGQRLAAFALSKPAAAARVAARSGTVLAREQRERVARLRDDHLATNEQLAQADKALRDAEAILAAQDTADDTLRAPADGIVLGIQAQRGATIAAGTPVMTFADGGKVGFVGGIEPGDMSRVHAGDIVSLHSLSGGAPQAGQVTAVAAVVNPVSRLVDVTAASPLPLLQGASYRADIVVGKLEGWRLPTDAIVGDEGARAAWQVVGGKAHRVAVRVIAQHGDEALVEGAIDASLPLVTVGAAQLEEGVQVRPAVSK
jgi:RND family efflux transporter MFP subunit